MRDNQESRFTRSRVDCPHPEYWHSTDSDSTEIEVTQLVGSFVRGLQPDFCIETGTAFGQTAKAIGFALSINQHGSLTTLEVDQERCGIARANVAGLPVTVLEMKSLDYTPERMIDFMWIDSLEELRGPEIIKFSAFASPRCVIGVHDTGPHKGLRRSIEGLIRDGIITQPLFLPTPRGVMFARLEGAIW